MGLVIAAPYPMVPGTAGMAQAMAAQRLRNAGFQVRVTHEGRDLGAGWSRAAADPHRLEPSEAALRHHAGDRQCRPPRGGAAAAFQLHPRILALPHACTRLRLRRRIGGWPCLHRVRRVTGSDPYDLDADGDGLACES